MRINYYQFPENVDPDIRYRHGTSMHHAICTMGMSPEQSNRCVHKPETGCRDCRYYKVTDSGLTVEGASITTVKKLLKEFGGIGWTEHCDRSGGVFEATPIHLKGNHSNVVYNHHL